MRKLGVTLLVAAFFVGGAGLAQKLSDRGAFSIYLNGSLLGKEEFTIAVSNGSGTVTTRSSLTVPKEDRVVTVGLDTVLTLGNALAARSYDLSISEGRERQSIKVLFGPDKAACTFDLGEKKETQDVVFPAAGVVLDHNIFSQVAVLLLRYDVKRPGSQGFSVFVPQLGKDGIGTVFIRYLGKDESQTARRRVKGEHFVVSSPNLTMDVWRDADGRVQKILIPQTGAEIERTR